MPRSSGSAFAIGSVSTVIVASFRFGELAAAPLKTVAAARTTASSAEPKVSRFIVCVLSFAGSGILCLHERRVSLRSRDLLALDLAVHVSAELHELRQLLRRDLVAGAGQIDRDDLLDLRRRMR